MTTFNSSIEIDEDILVEVVTESSDFQSKVESIIDAYDVSDQLNDALSNYDFDYEIQNNIDRYNFVGGDDFDDNIISAIQRNDRLQTEIRYHAGESATDGRIPEMIHTLHSVCGKLAQQMAIMNAMTGTSPWPNEVVTELQSIGATLLAFGIDVTDK